MLASGSWSASKAWALGIVRYVDGVPTWVGEMRLYGEDGPPYAEVEHDHQRGVTYG